MWKIEFDLYVRVVEVRIHNLQAQVQAKKMQEKALAEYKMLKLLQGVEC